MQIVHSRESNLPKITAEMGLTCTATLSHASILLEKVFPTTFHE